MAKRHTNRVGDLQSMFLRLEELVLANSGADEFEVVLRLVMAKLWDELAGEGRFAPARTAGDTAAAVEALLHEASRAWPGIVPTDSSMGLSAEQLHICVEALAPHSIRGDGLHVLDGFFEFLVARAAKGAKGQFFTPRHVVEMCVRMVDPSPHESVVDPACGSGGFLFHALAHAVAKGLRPEAAKDYCSRLLWGFDIDERAVRVARALMVIAGDGAANIFRLNSLARTPASGLLPGFGQAGDVPSLTVEDVLRGKSRKHRGFDVLLSNPPFAGEIRERALLDSYDFGLGRRFVERDELFVERAAELLRPGGRFAIVLPQNKVGGDSFSGLREWLLRRCRIVAVVGLGRHTFLPHTSQKTCVVVGQRRSRPETPTTTERTLFAVSERDGKDSSGQFRLVASEPGAGIWERVDHDIEEVCGAFREFCRAENVWTEERDGGLVRA